jgi:hypothetical protein
MAADQRRFVYRSVLINSWIFAVLIPMKVVSDSDLIPVTRSDVMAVTIGAKRRWRPYGA